MANWSDVCLGVLALGLVLGLGMAALLLVELRRMRHELGRVLPRYARAADEASVTLQELRRVLKRANRIAQDVEGLTGEARGVTGKLRDAAAHVQHQLVSWWEKRMGNGARVAPRRSSRA